MAARTTKKRAPASRKTRGAAHSRVVVDLGERSYPIEIGHGTLASAGDAIAAATGAERAAIITVPEVGRRYAPRLERSLRQAGIKPVRITVPDGDKTKNLRQLGKLYDAFVEHQLDRSSVVVALGGGMVGDLSGFAAASYLRGIPFVQVPTTLLAMVDASVGGKVAINLPQGKNLAGAFYQPRLVWVDTETLASLPARDRAAGMTEIIKAGAIWDRALFESLEGNVERALALDAAALHPVVERACEIKAEVVSQDEREGGVRMLLNFGHTLGHAVEKIARYRGILHGEAVAIGMVYAAELSESLGLARNCSVPIRELLGRTGVPLELPDHPRKAYLAALGVDKKKKGSRVHFVVLRRIGRAETRPMTLAQIFPAKRARRRA